MTEPLTTTNPLLRLMDLLDHGVLWLGPGCELEHANPAAQRLLGFGDPESARLRWAELAPQLRAALERAADSAVATDPTEGLSIEVRLPGSRPKPTRVRFEIFPLDEASDEGHLVLLRDLEMAEALETDLRMAARFRGLNSLYRATAHDLKAPINAIMINLELLRDTVQGTAADMLEPAAADAQEVASASNILRARQERYLATLTGEMERLERTLHSLLSQTIVTTEATTQFDLCALLHDLIVLITPQARRQQITLQQALDPGPVELQGSPDWLKQALVNIAINALEALQAGGELHIELERTPATSNGAVHAPQAVVRIRDNGPGIPEEQQASIWRMHYSTKEQGTGIGLYVSRNVIESHGGHIRLHSQPGHGCTFEMTLPIAPRPGESI